MKSLISGSVRCFRFNAKRFYAAKFIPYSYLGLFTYQALLAGIYLAPVALIGAWLGVRAHRLIPERAFFALTYVLLTLTGLKLIWDALA